MVFKSVSNWIIVDETSVDVVERVVLLAVVAVIKLRVKMVADTFFVLG
jgi:hypothetical protein